VCACACALAYYLYHTIAMRAVTSGGTKGAERQTGRGRASEGEEEGERAGKGGVYQMERGKKTQSIYRKQ